MTATSSWPCPNPVYVGDELEVLATIGSFQQKMTVKSVRYGRFDTYADCEIVGLYGVAMFTLPLSSNDYVWRRCKDVETLPCIEAAAPAKSSAEYGVHCARCNTFCEHAEKKSGFVCFGCRS